MLLLKDSSRYIFASHRQQKHSNWQGSRYKNVRSSHFHSIPIAIGIHCVNLQRAVTSSDFSSMREKLYRDAHRVIFWVRKKFDLY